MSETRAGYSQTASDAAAGAFTIVEMQRAAASRAPQPQHGTIDVEVHGLHRIDLVPTNDLARSVLQTMLHATVSASCSYRGFYQDAEQQVASLERMTLRFRYEPSFSAESDAGPTWGARRLTADQAAVVKRALARFDRRRDRELLAPGSKKAPKRRA
jgi:hypothetical protein